MAEAGAPVRVLGVSGSPRQGATSRLVRAALRGAADAGASVEFVPLAGLRITPCDGCAPCVAAGACAVRDDMTPLYDSLLAADAILVGSPVYAGTVSALCKAFLERATALGMGEKRLRLKIGGAIAAGGSRHGGQETTLLAIHSWFVSHDMIGIGMTSPLRQWGTASSSGMGLADVERDEVELHMAGRTVPVLGVAWMYGRKLATVARIVREGRAASGLDLPDRPYGAGMPETFPPEILHFPD